VKSVWIFGLDWDHFGGWEGVRGRRVREEEQSFFFWLAFAVESFGSRRPIWCMLRAVCALGWTFDILDARLVAAYLGGSLRLSFSDDVELGVLYRRRIYSLLRVHCTSISTDLIICAIY
jgi:hypothetical protein